MYKKQRNFNFNEQMDGDLQFIKSQFKDRFKIIPSNTQILNLLLQTYKETNLLIERKPKKKKCFVIKF